jgi:DNA-binding LacI/PurR family transcriptional regulator
MKSKYETVADNLKQRIFGLEPGTRLPSIRRLVKETGVSQFTVSKAMELLEEEGLVMRRSAMGIFSSYQPESAAKYTQMGKRRILILNLDGVISELGDMLIRILSERGFLAQTHGYSLADSPERWLPRIRFEGVVFFGSCPPEFVAAMKKRNLPFVTQGLQNYHLEVDNTCGDERMGGAIAAKHLIELGHRRIALLMNEPDESVDNHERLRGFINQCHLMEAEPGILDCKMRWGDDGRKKAKEILEAELARGPFPYTALFAIGDPGATSALHVFYQHQIRVPEQVSVMGCDDRPEVAYLCPALTTLGYNLRDRVNAIADILEQRFAGDTSPRIRKTFEPFLIKRDSTAPPPSE